MPSQKKKVIIIGGGIAGLSAAHYLCKYPEFEITVLESQDDVGGQARSMYGKYCYIEYSWRIFGKTYHNLNRIIHEINADNNFTYLDNPCIINEDNDAKYGSLSIDNLAKNVIRTASIKQINRISDILTISRDRAINEYDDIKAFEYFDKHPIMQTIMGPFLGLDANKISLSAFYKNILSTQDTSNYKFIPNETRVSKYPTQESLFVPWVKFLKDHGVQIKTSTKVVKIVTNTIEGNIKTISGLVVENAKNGNTSFLEADDFIFACSLKPLNEMLDSLEIPKTIKNDFKKLENGLQLYYTINMYFNIKLPLTKEKDRNLICNETILVETPWKLIIQRKQRWGPEYLNKCKLKSNKIKDVFNVGFLDNNPGQFNKKKVSDCSKEEAIKEGILQFQNNPYIKSILDELGVVFDDIFLGYEDWYEFVEDKNHKLISLNPKFSNNVGLLKHMPASPNISGLPANMFLSGYYVCSTMGGVSMEASCETGLNAGAAVIKKNNIPYRKSRYHIPITHNVEYLTGLTSGLVYLDKLLYWMGIPSLNNIIPSLLLILFYFVVLIIVLVLIIYSIHKLFKKLKVIFDKKRMRENRKILS